MNINSFYDIAKAAALSKKKLYVNYTDRNMNFSTRLTEPYEIKGGIYFGYTEDTGASGTIGIRKFRISRIREAWVSDQEFIPRWEVKIV